MPVKVLRYEPTPNPNALKCILSAGVSTGSLPFRSAQAAAGHPLAAAIFALPGVTGLLLCGDWLTVNKAADARWPAIKKGVEKTLAAYP